MNKTSIASFDSHDRALEAVVLLRENSFPIERVSVEGKADVTEDKIHVRSNDSVMRIPVMTGSVIGAGLGLLTGIKTISIPGISFLYDTGWVIGIMGGFGIGIAIGGLISLALQLIYRKNYSLQYDEKLTNGSFNLYVNGTNEEINWAQRIIGENYSGYDIREKIKLPGTREHVYKNI